MYIIPDSSQAISNGHDYLLNQQIQNSDHASVGFLLSAENLGCAIDWSEIEDNIQSDFPSLALFNTRQKVLTENSGNFFFNRGCFKDWKNLSKQLDQRVDEQTYSSNIVNLMLGMDLLPQHDIEKLDQEFYSASKSVIEIAQKLNPYLLEHAKADESNISFGVYAGDLNDGIGLVAGSVFAVDASIVSSLARNSSIKDVVWKILCLLCYFGDVQTPSDTVGLSECVCHEEAEIYSDWLSTYNVTTPAALFEAIEAKDEIEERAEEIYCDSEQLRECFDLLHSIINIQDVDTGLSDDFFTDVDRSIVEVVEQAVSHLTSDSSWGGNLRGWVSSSIQTLQSMDTSFSSNISYPDDCEGYDIYYCSGLHVTQKELNVFSKVSDFHSNGGMPIETILDANTELQSQAALNKITTIMKCRTNLSELPKNDFTSD